MSRQFRTFPLAAPTAATALRGRSRKQCRNVRFRAWRGGRRHRLEVVDALGDIADGTGIGLVFLGNTLCRNTSCLSSGYLSALCLLLCALRVRIRRGIALTLYKRNKHRKARWRSRHRADTRPRPSTVITDAITGCRHPRPLRLRIGAGTGLRRPLRLRPDITTDGMDGE